ncbi:hypothetical protein CPB97_011425 [Podila verticillata]|nr:hypothetical protein CPB97_011425 [Podila verticillata]
MDPDWAHTQVSPLSKINMDLVRMDSRRDSAVGIASANSEATNAPSPLGSYSSVLSQPTGNTSHTTDQHDVPDTPAQATDKVTESSKAKKKKKKKGKGATTGTTSSGVSSHLENPGDTSPDSGGGQYQPPDGDDLEWLESAVVKGDTKPMGKKSKTKKKPSKRNDSKKVVENKDGDRIITTDDENNQESEGKADDTPEEDTIDSHNIDMEEHKNIPTDSLAFIEDDSFMSEGGTSNWADDMAELDPQPWADMGLGGQSNNAADHGSPITPPSSTSSSIASSSMVSWTSARADDPQESRSTSLPTVHSQDTRFYERQDRRPPQSDHRGQPRPPRPDRPPRSSRVHPKDPQARPHYPSNYSERLERPERPSRHMRPRLERYHEYENWAPSAADPRDHHAVSQRLNQRQPRSLPLPPRPDIPLAGAHVPHHHYPSGHPGQSYSRPSCPDHGHSHGHPGYLVDSDLLVTPGSDRFFHPRPPRPKAGYEMFATDANGHPSRQDNHWRKKQPQQQHHHHQQKQEKKNKREQEQLQQNHEDVTPTPPTHAMSKAVPELSANGLNTPLEHVDTDEVVPPLVADGVVAPALVTDDVMSAPLGDEAPRPRTIMGLAMIGRQMEPWEDRDKVIELLNRRWTEAMRSVGLEENTTAIFYTSEM